MLTAALFLLQNHSSIRAGTSRERPSAAVRHHTAFCGGSFCDLNLPNKVINCIIIADWQHKDELRALLLVTLDFLLMQKPEVFISTSKTNSSSVMLETQVFVFLAHNQTVIFRQKNQRQNNLDLETGRPQHNHTVRRDLMAT